MLNSFQMFAGSKIKVKGGPSWPKDKHSPTNTCDGNFKNYWAGDPQANKWTLTYDLGEVKPVPTFKIDYFSTRYMAKDTTIDISTDGKTWQPFGAMSKTNPSSINIGQSLRYLRVNFFEKAKDKQPAIKEVTFGEPSSMVINYKSMVDDTMQPARVYIPTKDKVVPLVVGLHTWSGNYKQRSMPDIEKWCVSRGWAYIHPNFRGPNWTPQASGSELVVQDIVSAVEFMKKSCRIDTRRIYLVGWSGGGYHALLMAGRRPDIWAGVSAWVPISDLATWYKECANKKRIYAIHIVKSCGGKPGESEEVDKQLALRSPVSWLKQAIGLPVDINAGIFDGHHGVVPISHSLVAFNHLARQDDRISDKDICFMTDKKQVPKHLKQAIIDPLYGSYVPLFRRQSGNARITIFRGGHQIIQRAAFEWLIKQRKLCKRKLGVIVKKDDK